MKKKLTKLRFTDSDNDYQITMWQEEVRLGGGGGGGGAPKLYSISES